MQAFRAVIKKRIEETGIGMSELARQANVGRPYLYRVLAGEQVPSIVIAERIAGALDLQIQTVPATRKKSC